MYERNFSNSLPACRAIILGLVLVPMGALGEPASSEQTGPDLVKMFEQQGWQAETAPDGSLIFRRPQKAVAKPTETPEHMASPASVATATPSEIERLLRERGWQTETDPSGNTLLRPTRQSTAGSQASDKPSTVTPVANAAEAADPFEQFQHSLSDKGWQVERTSDGSVIVYPPKQTGGPGTSKADMKPTQRGHCEGISSTAVSHGEIGLPIDTPAKAARVATDWIAHFGEPGYVAGRVRRINQIYLVSVVDRHPPYQLRNQLIIRSDSGRTIAVH